MTPVKPDSRRKLKRPVVGEKAKLPLVLTLTFLTGIALTLASILITTQSLRKTLSWFAEKPLALFACALFLTLITLFLAGVTRSLFAGGLITAVPVLAASFVNYFKTLITATPLQLSDLGLIGKVGGIAELNSASITFSRNSIIALAAVVLWLAALLYFSGPLRMRWVGSLAAAGAAAALFAVMFAVKPAAGAWCYEPLGAGFETDYAQAFANDRCGVILGLWRSALGLGDGYKIPEDERAAVLSDAQSYINDVPAGGGNSVRPNVIMILSESFFDVTKLPGVTYEEDPVADFHAAQAAGISGAFHTRTLGYGTCNIELEMLTGINNRFFTSDDQLCYWSGEKFDRLSAMPEIFQDNGYYTAFLHTFNDGIYNRTPMYTHLGFDDLYFSGDFAKIDPEAAAAEDYWGYMEGKIAGEFYSDDYLADVLIDLYQEKSPEEPVFLFGATMENHTPYESDKFDGYDYPVASALDGEAAGELNAYTQGAADSSKALGKLIDYFSQSDDPTVIIFFGDHRPGLPLSDGGTVYSALGMCDESNANWTTEEVADLYSTDYVIWANDESLLPAEPGTRADTSSAFLGLDALRAAGLGLDPYWRMIASMKQSCTAYTWSYYISKGGAVTDSLPDDMSDYDLRKFDDMTWLMREAFSENGGHAAFYELS